MARTGLHHALLILALLALPFATGLPSESLEATFSSPAQAEGNLTATALRGVLVLFDGQEAAVDLHFEGGVQAVTHTLNTAEHELGVVSHGRDDMPGMDSDPVSYGDELSIQLEPQGRSSLYLEAEAIQVHGADSKWEIWRSMPGGCLAFQVHGREAEARAFRADVSKCAGRIVVVLRVDASGDALAFELDAQGVRRGEWHNMDVQCPTSACPEGGLRDSQTMEPYPDYSATYHEYRYVEVTAQGGRGNATGHAAAVLAQGTGIGLNGTGSLRLPQVQSQGTCENLCSIEDNDTLSATGSFAFTNLQPAEDEDRLQAGLTGEFSSVRLDEAALDVLPVEVQVAAGVLLGAVVLGAAAYWLGLFSRIEDKDLLKHPRTKQLHELILADPGLSFRDLDRRLGWGRGNLTHHLERLMRAKVIQARPYRHSLRYFENHGRYNQAWKGLSVLQDQDARRLLEWLNVNPAVTQRAAVDHAQESWEWPRVKTQRVLEELVDSELVQATLGTGRRKHYHANAAGFSVPAKAAVAG